MRLFVHSNKDGFTTGTTQSYESHEIKPMNWRIYLIGIGLILIIALPELLEDKGAWVRHFLDYLS